MPSPRKQPYEPTPAEILQQEGELTTRLCRLDRHTAVLTALGLALDRIISGDDALADEALGLYQKVRRQSILNVQRIDELWQLMGGYDDEYPF